MLIPVVACGDGEDSAVTESKGLWRVLHNRRCAQLKVACFILEKARVPCLNLIGHKSLVGDINISLNNVG